MSEAERPTHEPGAAIDLSRRKGAAGRARPGHESRGASGQFVRESIVVAGLAAAPFVTSTRIALMRLARSRLARVGGLFMALLALVGVFADLLASDLPIACRCNGIVYILPNVTRPMALVAAKGLRSTRERGSKDWMLPALVAHSPVEAGNSAEPLIGPWMHGHPLGTDASGRDVFARIVHGARSGLGIGLAASIVLVAIGVTLGALAGFSGGVIDALVARAVESLSAVPTLVLVLVVGALVPHPTTLTVMSTIALTRWTELARLVRAEVLSALGADYVSAARALGASSARVLWRHVLPNVMGPALVGATFAIAWVVLIQATIDFLRVGSSDTMASWGELMGEARFHREAWWLVVFPGVFLFGTLTALNLIGEAARNALDPRMRGDELTR